MSRTDPFGIGPPNPWADIQEIELEHEMIDPIAHEFCPPSPGYSELPSIKLAREIDRFDASAEMRKLSDSIAKDFLLLAIVGLAAFFACFGGAAIVDQGRDNLKTWVAAHEPV